MTIIQKRLMDSIGRKGSAVYNRALGLAMFNGADPTEVDDEYHLALWFEGAPVSIKNEFLDSFNERNNDLRICTNCGCFMSEGYLLDRRYACSDACAIALFDGDEPALRECIRASIEDDDGDYFWTEW